MAVSVIYDPAYLNHNTGNHPENSRRLERILESVKSGDLGERIRMQKPLAASVEDVVRVHSREMVDHVKQLCESGARYIDMDTHISRESYDVALLAAGAAISAVGLVLLWKLAS